MPLDKDGGYDVNRWRDFGSMEENELVINWDGSLSWYSSSSTAALRLFAPRFAFEGRSGRPMEYPTAAIPTVLVAQSCV